jgi:hypothetical protein
MANSNFKSVTFKRVMCNSVLTSCGKRAALIFKICELYGYDQKRNETQLRAYPVHRQPGGRFSVASSYRPVIGWRPAMGTFRNYWDNGFPVRWLPMLSELPGVVTGIARAT